MQKKLQIVVSVDELKDIIKSVEKMSLTDFVCPQTNDENLKAALRKRGIENILCTYVISASQMYIRSKDSERGYVRLYEKPILLNYAEAFAESLKNTNENSEKRERKK